MKKPIKVAIVLLLNVIFTTFALPIFISNDAYGRYFTKVNSTDQARVALFKVEDTGIYNKTIALNDVYPGCAPQTHTFTIKNSSEVAIKCSININATTNLPLEYKVNGTTIIPGTPYVTENFQPNETSTRTFTLTISWKDGYNDIKYAEMIDAIQIVVVSEQVN